MNMNQIRLTAAGWAAHLKYSACAHRNEKLLALGVDHCLVKPYSMQNLFDRARLLCQKGGGRRAWLN